MKCVCVCVYGLASNNWVGPCNVKIVGHLIELEASYGLGNWIRT